MLSLFFVYSDEDQSDLFERGFSGSVFSVAACVYPALPSEALGDGAMLLKALQQTNVT